MARTLVIATRNRKKLEEIAAILEGLDLALASLEAYDVEPVAETGETFEENARLKALGYAQATGEWALSDDSGLEVDALDGRPGVYSSRWGGSDGDDRRNNETLLEALQKDHPQEDWTARYRCVMALATPERVLFTAEGSCEGRIVADAAGSNGFGYDPHFFLDEFERTMAELPPETKNALSHRWEALRGIRKRLEKLL
jgi:XTP/dITP diphosphohydrolase